MGFLGGLFSMALDVIETPIAIVKDVVTLGGALTDEDEPYTAQKIGELSDDYDCFKMNLKD